MTDHQNPHRSRGNERSESERVRQLERQVERLMDLYDTIAAAIEAKNNGDNPTYDQHLQSLDQQISALQGTESGDATNIANIEAGLQKIANAVNPPAPTPAPTPAQGTAAASGSGSASAGTGAPTNAGTVDPAAQTPTS